MRLVEQFKKEIRKELSDEKFIETVLKYEEINIYFIWFAKGKQSNTSYEFAMRQAKSCRNEESKNRRVNFVRFCHGREKNKVEDILIEIIRRNNSGKDLHTFLKHQKQIEDEIFENKFEMWLTRLFNYNQRHQV